MASSSPSTSSSTSDSSAADNVVKRASISRERFLKPTKGKYSERGTSDTKNVCLYERIKQFPEESLCLGNGKLFCDACKEPLGAL